MAKTKFTFTTAEGKVETRTSERTYTHVVVGRVDIARLRRDALARAEQYAESWEFHKLIATTPVGERWEKTKSHCVVSERMSAEYRAKMAAHPDKAAYVADNIAAALAAIDEIHGTGDVGREVALQWSMSEANAVKGASTHSKYYLAVAVRPVDAK